MVLGLLNLRYLYPGRCIRRAGMNGANVFDKIFTVFLGNIFNKDWLK